MDKYKITDSELESGVVAAPNILNDTPQENKSVFDRLPRLIATKVNGFIDAVSSKFAGYYTREEVDGAISQKIVDIGAGDMAMGVYDKTRNGIVDNSERVNGMWFDFTDAEGNPTDEPHIHWYEDEDGKPVYTAPSIAIDLYGDFSVETDGDGTVTIRQGE